MLLINFDDMSVDVANIFNKIVLFFLDSRVSFSLSVGQIFADTGWCNGGDVNSTA